LSKYLRSSPNKFSLVFVCTGNICRSPIAEGIMKDLILDELESHGRSLPIKLASAGTYAVDGNPASEYAIMVAAQHDIDISFHRSRFLSEEIVNDADLILTMEKNHTNNINQTWPHIKCVYELKSFGRESSAKEFNREIMDPIGMGFDDYVNVFNEIKKEILRVAQIIYSLAREKDREH